MNRVKLTTAQLSALECADLSDVKSFIFDRGGREIAFFDSKEAAGELTDLANSEDALAAELSKKGEPTLAKWARGARDSLGNLAAKLI